ncbi:MAG: hypothetical protein Kow00106_17610 [Anaerolineae bacterium]
MVKHLRRAIGVIVRSSGRTFLDVLLRHGGRTVIESALESAAGAVPKGEQAFVQVFPVTAPLTVYVRASHCHVTVRQHQLSRVELNASLGRAFGVDLMTEQDDAGIYIVARRKPVVGTVARLDLTLTLPPAVRLAFHLTPGDITFAGVDGLAEMDASQVFAPFPAVESLPAVAQVSD